MNEIVKKASDFVELMLRPLDEGHFYHNYEHALEVMERAIYLAKKLDVSADDIEILALAAIFHDTGFIVQYDENEIIWAKIAHNYLKTIGYPEEKIHKVETLIIATDPDYTQPKNILEEIIKDADLNNLWTTNFITRWELLLQEIRTIKDLDIDMHTWHVSMLKLIKNNIMYTEIQKTENSNGIQQNIDTLTKLVKHENSNFIEIEL